MLRGINEQVNMLWHVNKACEPPSVIFDCTIDGDAELFAPPVVVQNWSPLVTRKRQLVNLANGVEVLDSFSMRLGKWHSGIVAQAGSEWHSSLALRTAGRASSGAQ